MLKHVQGLLALYVSISSYLPLQAAGSNALQPPQRPRRARREPASVPAPTSSPVASPAARHNPAAHRHRTGSGSRLPQPAGPPAGTRGGTQRLPHPARSSAQPLARPAGLSPPSAAAAHPTPPRAGAAHWLRRLPDDEQPRPALVRRGRSLRKPPSEGRRAALPSAAAATAPVTPRFTRPRLPAPQLSAGAGGGS